MNALGLFVVGLLMTIYAGKVPAETTGSPLIGTAVTVWAF